MNTVREYVHGYVYDCGMRLGVNEAGLYDMIFHISGI